MSETVYYKGFTLIDGTGSAPVHNAGMLVENGKVSNVFFDQGKPPEGQYSEVDLSGKTVMPGLINSHVHIIMEPIGNPFTLIEKESDVKTAMRGVVNLKKTLRSGVTYFRDMGGYNFIDIELKKCLAEGMIEGPDFLVSGKVITMTGGHGHQMGRECDGVSEVRKAAREQLKAGVDVVKIMATGGVMTQGVEPGSAQLTYEEIKAAVEEANKAGRKTATHAQGTTGIKNAVRAGINSVEHGMFLDDEVIEMMIERNVYLVPTLVAPYFIVEYGVEGGIPEYAVEKSKRVMESHFESFRKAYKAGVKIAMGTDAGTPFNMHEKAAYELKLMIEAGVDPMDAIVFSTRGSAELLGVVESHGTLEQGKAADFLVLKENPLEDISTLLDVEQVYKGGKPVK